MKRFKITNNKSGLSFQVEREALGKHEPEWGRHERWLTEEQAKLEGLDLKDAIETREVRHIDPMGASRTEYKFAAEYTIEVEDITEQVEQAKVNAEAEAYLRETDWYIVREMDEGIPCPPEVKQARAQARAKIVR